IDNHVVHADADQIADDVFVSREAKEWLKNRIMVTRKAERIDIECVVRGYITGGGWRQYEKTGEVNGHKLPQGLRKNQRFDKPIFTPAAKNDVGHDEDISIARMAEMVGAELTAELQEKSIQLYEYAWDYCL